MTNYFRNLCIIDVILAVISVGLSIVYSILGFWFVAVLAAFLGFVFASEATEKYDQYREWRSIDILCEKWRQESGEPDPILHSSSIHKVCNICEGEECPHPKCKYSKVNLDETSEIKYFTCGRKEEDKDACK